VTGPYPGGDDPAGRDDPAGGDVPPGALALALDLAGWAVDRLRPRSPGPDPDAVVTTKAHGADLLTADDTAVEDHVRAAIRAAFPGHRIVGEEAGGTGPVDADCTWWVDPVDGTTNHANRLPWASFSLALTVNGHPVLGVVADPYRGEVFAAAADTPVTVGDRRVHCSPTATLAGTVVLTEWAAHLPWPGMDRFLAGIAAASGTSRVMGSSALSLASVAAGRAAAAVIGSWSPVDDLAGAYLASRSGAVVITCDGSLTPPTGGIAVAVPGVADAVRALLPWWAAHPTTR